MTTVASERSRSDPDLAMGRQLAGWGRVALLETRGRRTGRAVAAAVGFVEEPDATLLVAAGSDDTGWALNLLADPHCTVEKAGERRSYVAQPLDGRDHARAVTELILKYGTPAEGLGRGPSFALHPADAPGGEISPVAGPTRSDPR